jgi:4-alpha-glucanotransferase
VRLIGDVPIYVALGSVDHRTHPELFRDDAVAGTPPDAYTDKGQLWGNPLYDWPALRRRGYRWWTERLRRTFELYDLARIDHFRGFCAYWAVPKGARHALAGRWQRGPGRAPFDAAARELGELPVIAENLGVITDAVERLRTSLGYPGMVVLQFGFPTEDPKNVHTPVNHREDTVVYTGTHDNDTAAGWWAAQPDDVKARIEDARAEARIPVDEPWWVLVELALSSRSRLAIVQAQDVLGLGSEARTNTPGTFSGNWSWRLEPGQLTIEHAARLREATARWDRLPR